MLSQLSLLEILVLLVCVLTVMAILQRVKNFCMTGSCTVSKATDDGEQTNYNENFYVWDTQSGKREKVYKLYHLSDERNDFTIQRSNEIMDRALKEKEAEIAAQGKLEKIK